MLNQPVKLNTTFVFRKILKLSDIVPKLIRHRKTRI